MTPAERLLELRSLVAHHDERYYNDDAPAASYTHLTLPTIYSV